MTSADKVKAIHPRARAERFTTHGRQSYYLIFADRVKGAKRLGQGKTASAAWVDAAATLPAAAQ